MFKPRNMDEISLYEKLSVLQAKMLKFNEEISPVKQREAEKAVVIYDDESRFLSTCIYIAFVFLKILVCLIVPTLFPAIVYCLEGSSPLFWQITAVSCLITLLLALFTVTVLCMNLKIVLARTKEVIKTLRNFFSQNGSMNSDFLKANAFTILCPLVLLFLSVLLGYISYTWKMSVVFYTSLVLDGFICGVLACAICDIVKSPELLPFHSPYKFRMEPATPIQEAKRELEFTPCEQKQQHQQAATIPATRGLLGSNTTLINNDPGFVESPITHLLPNYSASIKKTEENTKTYQLPSFDFSKFLRGLRLN